MQKNSFIGFHIGQVERHGLVTASGAPPVVEVESIECFMAREDCRIVAAVGGRHGNGSGSSRGRDH